MKTECTQTLTRTNSVLVKRVIDTAIPFSPRPVQGTRAGSLRVATTLVTCATAVAVLNEMGVQEESESAYRYINVHNPQCPLVFNRSEGGWTCRPGMENHPLYGVNWAGALLMCRHMGGRLPLAHEWECFASNNDPGKKYPWGSAAPTCLLANFGEYLGGVSRVGSFPPTELGLYDIAGNLGEWCHDAYGVQADGRASLERVVKGGAWSKDAHHLEIAASRGKWERLGTTTIGFRPVWDE